jgi:hypothetical protein
MDLVSNTVEMNRAHCHSEFGMGLGPEEYEFVFGYVKFLGDCLIDWNDREMVPRFVAPLTRRGRGLVTLIGQKEDQLRSARLLSDLGLIRVGDANMVPADHTCSLNRAL